MCTCVQQTLPLLFSKEKGIQASGKRCSLQKSLPNGKIQKLDFFLFVLVHHEGIHVSHDRFLMPQLQHPAKTILLPYEGSIQSYIG